MANALTELPPFAFPGTLADAQAQVQSFLALPKKSRQHPALPQLPQLLAWLDGYVFLHRLYHNVFRPLIDYRSIASKWKQAYGRFDLGYLMRVSAGKNQFVERDPDLRMRKLGMVSFAVLGAFSSLASVKVRAHNTVVFFRLSQTTVGL